MSNISVTVNGQSGPNVTATTGDQVGVVISPSSSSLSINVSQAGTPGGIGPQGPQGSPYTTVGVGSTTTLAAGSNATVTATSSNSGQNLTLNFGIPAGLTPSIAIGTVTTGAPGSSASATTTATNGGANVTLNLTIPRGATGATGSTGTSVTLSDATPANLGTAAAGSSSLAARADHVHTLPTASAIGAAAANHAHNYVTGLNNLTGNLTLAAGSNVTLTANGSTLTLASTGGIGANDAIDGGDYVGQLVYGIVFGTQPQNTNATSTATVNFATVANATLRGVQALGGTLFAGNSVYSNPGVNDLVLQASTNNGDTWANINTAAASWGDSYADYTLYAMASNGSRSLVCLGGRAFYSDSSDLSVTSPVSSLASGATPTSSSVAWNGTRWVMVQKGASNAWALLSSSDGVNWTSRLAKTGTISSRVMTIGTKFVVLYETAGDGMYVATSTDGVAWASGTKPFSGVNAASSGSRVVAVNGTASRSSTDGVTWSTGTLPVSVGSVSHAAGLFWAFSGSGTDVCYSVDGISWTLGAMPTSQAWAGAAGTNSTALIYNSDTSYYYPAQTRLARATVGQTYGSANLTVSATATGGGSVSYQWQSSLDAGTTWANIANATTSTLSLTNLTTADNGTRYRAMASATGATPAYSQTALLTVN